MIPAPAQASSQINLIASPARKAGLGDKEIGDKEIGDREIGDEEIGDNEIGENEIGDI